MNRSTTTKKAKQSFPAEFEELCALYPPRPIHDTITYDNTQEIIDQMLALSERTEDQEQYLETLSTLIEAYEDERYPIDVKIDPIKVLKSLMDDREMNASDLGRVLGNRSLGSAILRRERKISKLAAVRLGEHFRVSPALFIKP